MKKKQFMKLTSLIVATLFLIASFGLITGCNDDKRSSKNDKFDSWANTDGGAGRINMEAVAAAMNLAKDPSDLEKRINEIYEGEELVLIKVESVPDGRKKISGWADMNTDGSINANTDDELFSAVMGEKDYELQGSGVNSHYRHRHSGLSMGDAMFLAWVFSPSYRPYYTPMSHVTVIRSNRSSYRSSSSYSQQRSQNSSYQEKAKKANPKAYESAQKKTSPSRKAAMEKSRKSFQKRNASKAKSSGSGFMKRSSSKPRTSARGGRSSGRSGGK